ncbi:MAG: N-acetylglucosamine-6-phosphate deacetylase [Planctomycetales bacterium]|nr:N-acetylglucosamine-6-phosphate deacetylase [Planctomycetales bacterium]
MYFDLQINGYAGVDFNADDLCAEQLARACQQLAQDGVSGVLATVITADLESMGRRLQNLAAAREETSLAKQVVVGVHIEGPFINPQQGYVGAHPARDVRPADLDSAQRLLESAAGLTRVVTLAPECDPGAAVTRWLADQGVVVSAGHCNPDASALARSIDAGLSMFTHLGNGCPLTMHRHDNIIQRVLASSDRLSIGFIADGVHVPYFALKNYLAATGLERAFVVSDAISAAGCGPGVFQLGDQSVVVDDQLTTWSLDRQHLVGSALTLPAAANRVGQALGLTDAQIQRLLYHNPRSAIGMDST